MNTILEKDLAANLENLATIIQQTDTKVLIKRENGDDCIMISKSYYDKITEEVASQK